MPPAGPLVTDATVTWRVEDPDARLDGVRLWADLDLGDTAFRRTGSGWELELARADLPPVDRLEYLLEETVDGRTAMRTDPANPRQVGGAFGDHSWVSLGYREPAWLELEPVPGARQDLVVEGTPVGDVHVQVWAPDTAQPDEPLPLLLSHDGPEMDRLGGLTRFVGAMTALRHRHAAELRAERGAALRAAPDAAELDALWRTPVLAGVQGLRPTRVALLAPGRRDEWYAANPAYAAALCEAVVPALREAAPSTHRPVLVGQSLGALAALHAEWTHPGTFGGLLLQSGSFFVPHLDGHESGHGGWARITGFVEEVLTAAAAPSTLPVGVVFGSAEENAANNRLLAAALARLGVPVTTGEVRDGHTWTCWRDLLDPHLVGVLTAALRQAQGASAQDQGASAQAQGASAQAQGASAQAQGTRAGRGTP